MEIRKSRLWSILMVCDVLLTLHLVSSPNALTLLKGSRGPAVLDDFTSSYGYKFSDPAGYQWGGAQPDANKM